MQLKYRQTPSHRLLPNATRSRHSGDLMIDGLASWQTRRAHPNRILSQTDTAPGMGPTVLRPIDDEA